MKLVIKLDPVSKSLKFIEVYDYIEELAFLGG